MADISEIASLGRDDFVARHDLWTAEQTAAAAAVLATAQEKKLDLIRFAFPDQHGILRGKALQADALGQALRNGCALTTTLLAKDTSHKTVYPVFEPGGGFGMREMEGAGDFIIVPDPLTFRVLPWAPDSGWILCDAYFQNGARVPFATRHILRDALDRLDGLGYRCLTGIEIEFHLFKLEDANLDARQSGQPAAAPQVSLLTHGYNYLTEQRLDQAEPVLQHIRRMAIDLGLPFRSVESEFGPSQVEFTFHPSDGMAAADLMVLFRSAVKQMARRHGYLATFMCQPALPNLFPSGWHLHLSLQDKASGKNAFMPSHDDDLLSPVGQHFVAGLLAHAQAAAALTTPTLNGYKRYKPNSLAPDRAVWGRDNKGAMLRAIGGVGDSGTRIENRVGDPAANPYLYLASQVFAGMDGMDQQLLPPPPSASPYDESVQTSPRLPRNLIAAIDLLDRDSFFRGTMGDGFIDYFVHLKEAEIARFLSTVTDWEQREYLELY